MTKTIFWPIKNFCKCIRQRHIAAPIVNRSAGLGRDNDTALNTLTDNEITERKSDYRNPILTKFTLNQKFIVIGAGIDMQNDLRLITGLANTNPNIKYIIAPAMISEENLNKIKYELDGFSVLYSECNDTTGLERAQVLIIDFVVSPTDLCQYGSCIYLGNGYESTTHSIIETIKSGLPVSFSRRCGGPKLSETVVGKSIVRAVKNIAQICEWQNDALTISHRQ